MAKDLLMNACGDMDITEGDAQLVSGADQVRQAWIIHMSTYLGEWFLDQSLGIPYIQTIFSKIVSRSDLNKIFTDETLKVPGVIRVKNIVIGDIVPSTREVNVDVYADIEGEENALLRYTGTIPADGCETTGSLEYPLTLGDMAIWFDASDSSSYTATASSIVMQNKAGPGTATGYGSAGVPTPSQLNGIPAMLFDDSDSQYLEIEDTPAIRNASGDMAYFTVFVVVNPDDDGDPTPLGVIAISGTDGGNNQSFNVIVYDDGSNNMDVFTFEEGSGADSNTWGPTSHYGPVVYTIRVASRDAADADFFVYEDGVEVDSDYNLAGIRTDGGGIIGASLDTTDATTAENFFSGRIGEILVYAEALDDTERAAVETYLTEKWGI